MRRIVGSALFLSGASLWGLISIVPVEVSQNPGMHLQASASLSTKRGNSDTDNYKSALRMTYDDNATYVVWGQISGEYAEASGEKNVQKIYAHGRFIHNIFDKYDVVEAFLQSQEDAFKLIQKRRLAGGGYRGRFLRFLWEDAKLFVGLGMFYEYIAYTSSVDPQERNVRLNAYVAFTYPLTKRSSLALTSYVQPKVDDMQDVVSATKLEARMYVVDRLFLSFRISYDYDARPAIGVQKYDFYQDTAFIYEF